MCFSLIVIDIMVMTAHGIAIQDLADRLSVSLTLLLTGKMVYLCICNKKDLCVWCGQTSSTLSLFSAFFFSHGF